MISVASRVTNKTENEMNHHATSRVSAIVEVITPTLAAAYLSKSGGNRPLKRGRIDGLVSDIAAGRWVVNGEAIIFSDTGELIDGHHRLTAISKGNLAVQSLVVRNAPQASKATIDTGASRGAGDVLSINGVAQGRLVASIVAVLVNLANGAPRSVSPSHAEIVEFVGRNPDISAAAQAADGVRFSITPVIGAVFFVANRIGLSAEADDFCDVLRSGVPAYNGCPAHRLREVLIKDQLALRSMSRELKQRLVVHAWSKFEAREKVSTLRVPEVFRLKGWPDADVW